MNISTNLPTSSGLTVRWILGRNNEVFQTIRAWVGVLAAPLLIGIDDLPLLVDLDRIDAAVAAFVVVLLDGGLEGAPGAQAPHLTDGLGAVRIAALITRILLNVRLARKPS